MLFTRRAEKSEHPCHLHSQQALELCLQGPSAPLINWHLSIMTVSGPEPNERDYPPPARGDYDASVFATKPNSRSYRKRSKALATRGVSRQHHCGRSLAFSRLRSSRLQTNKI